MKTCIVFILILTGGLHGWAAAPVSPQKHTDGIRFFQGSWEDALKESHRQRKLIFLDISTSWCKACKYMWYSVFTEKEVARFFNAHFINMYVDGDGELGKLLGDRYERVTYPTLCFVDASGNRVGPVEGSMTAEELLDWARSVLPPLRRVPVSDAPEYRLRMAPGIQDAAGVVKKAERKAPAIFAERAHRWRFAGTKEDKN